MVENTNTIGYVIGYGQDGIVLHHESHHLSHLHPEESPQLWVGRTLGEVDRKLADLKGLTESLFQEGRTSDRDFEVYGNACVYGLVETSFKEQMVDRYAIKGVGGSSLFYEEPSVADGEGDLQLYVRKTQGEVERMLEVLRSDESHVGCTGEEAFGDASVVSISVCEVD